MDLLNDLIMNNYLSKNRRGWPFNREEPTHAEWLTQMVVDMWALELEDYLLN